jgi:two-component system phosphate regulon sensor histidine kinase PhoR
LRLSWQTRLSLALVLVVAVALATLTVLVSREQRRWVVERSLDELDRAARTAVADLPEAADWSELAHRMGGTLGYRITLIDSSGRVLGDSDVLASRLPAIENHAARPEVRTALEGKAGQAIRHSRTIGVDLAYVARPTRGKSPVAVVRLAEPLHQIGAMQASLRNLSFASATVALLVSIPILLWVVQRHARRIHDLERVAQRLTEGEAARALEQPDDDLGRLGRTLNRMASESRARLLTLERERDERERILSHLNDGVALIDADGMTVRANDRLAELLRLDRTPAPGEPFRAAVRLPDVDELLRQAASSDHPVEGEVRLWGSSPVFLRAIAIPLQAASRGAVLLVLHDLSEVERLGRVRQDFVANVSHELRTPLTSLRGYAETLLFGGLDDVQRREEFARIIHDQAVRLEGLVTDLLSLAELERPGVTVRRETFDLGALAAQESRQFEMRARSAGLALEVEPSGEVTVSADKNLIRQVIDNLLDNALKYTTRGRVTVRWGREEGRAWCEVQDTGVGIADDDLPRIFERFYRVDKVRSRTLGGTGLGLSIVKHVITLHGGRVEVVSRLGGGSRFRFELPSEA